MYNKVTIIKQIQGFRITQLQPVCLILRPSRLSVKWWKVEHTLLHFSLIILRCLLIYGDTVIISDGNQRSGSGWRGGSATLIGGSPAPFCKVSSSLTVVTTIRKQIYIALDLLNLVNAFGNLIGLTNYLFIFFQVVRAQRASQCSCCGNSGVKCEVTPQDHHGRIFVRNF